jgi:hypothetical protein
MAACRLMLGLHRYIATEQDDAATTAYSGSEDILKLVLSTMSITNVTIEVGRAVSRHQSVAKYWHGLRNLSAKVVSTNCEYASRSSCGLLLIALTTCCHKDFE